MQNLAHSEEYKGRTINIYYDTDPQTPDYWGNTDVFLVYDHRQFTVEVQGYDPEDIFSHIQEAKRYFYNGYWVFPVYAYIHSGVSLSLGRSSYPFNCPWDTSFRGFALVKRQKGWTYTRTKAEKVAASIVEEWDDILNGNVYGYDTGADSCWGFVGDEGLKDAISQAKANIDYEIKDAIRKHCSQVRKWIKSKTPLTYRKPLSV